MHKANIRKVCVKAAVEEEHKERKVHVNCESELFLCMWTRLSSDLQVLLWNNDRSTSGHICTGALAVSVRVISAPQVLVGRTLSAAEQQNAHE